MNTRITTLALAACMALTAGACTVKKTEDGEAPKVEGGKLPKYQVEPANVTVGQDTHTVVTPTLKINTDTTHHVSKTND